jgi:hypothetical protein
MNASLPGTLRGDLDEERVEPVGPFEHQLTHWFIPCGLGEAPETAMRKALLRAAREADADGVANLRFEATASPKDCLVAGLCPVLQPRTFRLSGDLVRIKEPPPAGHRPQEAPPGGPITVERSPRPEGGRPQAY